MRSRPVSVSSTSVSVAAAIASAAGLLAVALVGCGNKPSAEAAAFQQARQLVVEGKYPQAVDALVTYQADYPDGPHGSRAGLFLGKAWLAQGKFDDARQAFTETIRKFPETLEAHKCRYKLAVVALLEGDDARALARFRALADKPDGPLAAESTAFVAFLSKPPAAGPAAKAAPGAGQ